MGTVVKRRKRGSHKARRGEQCSCPSPRPAPVLFGGKNIASFEQKMRSTMLQSFHSRKDPTKAIAQALDRAIELSVGTRRYTITDGRLVYEQHRRYHYAYTLTQESWDLPDGTDLQLSSSDLAHSLPVELSNTKREAQRQKVQGDQDG